VLLELTRLDNRRYETRITRSDGVTFLVKGVGHMGAIPHDLAHFAVERGLRLRRGFWGSVADGALFESLTHVSGRRRPHAEQRSKEVLKRNKGELTETEILVGLFNQAFEDGLKAESPELRMRLARYIWTAPGHKPRQFSSEEIAAVCAAWKEVDDLWMNLPVGSTMELVWPEASAR
jgi:hypothetical protein